MLTPLRRVYELASLAAVAVVGQLVAVAFGDCGGVYYYAALAGLSTGYGVVGSVVAMWKIRDPLVLAQLAYQMQREVDDGEHVEALRAYYAHLHGITVAAAEACEPGVIRRAWTARAQAQASPSVARQGPVSP